MDSVPLSQRLNSVPYDRRWELLRPTIQQLYIVENKKLVEIIKIIQARHGFVAVESQYKYQIKKWGLMKSTPNQKKEAICRVVKSRAREGKTSVIKRGTKDFDTKNLQRYLKAESKRAISFQPAAIGMSGSTYWPIMNNINFGNRIFMNWNIPYGVLRPLQNVAADHLTPISDIQVTTPTSNHEPPSPMAVTIAEITAIDRAQLFVQGKHEELLQSMGKKQRLVMSTWMYQFWLFAFKTAKHWGKGPQNWTADLLGFEKYHYRTAIAYSSPSTPQNIDTPASQPTPKNDENHDLRTIEPPSLCRWSIHCRVPSYEQIPSPPPNTTTEGEQDWSDGYEPHNFIQKLCNNIESNQFSTLQTDEMPIGTKQVADAARRSPEELFKESLGFCIMGRNAELLEDLLQKRFKEDFDIDDTRPFHLAASYLDGFRKCSDIFLILNRLSLRKFYLNDLGHTVLDQLMITILKSHTCCPPNVVDDVFSKSKRFEGEDVDICGRWDADSDCIRQRLENGTPNIPFKWKHVFCHTSAQAICHCIGVLFWDSTDEIINTKSG